MHSRATLFIRAAQVAARLPRRHILLRSNRVTSCVLVMLWRCTSARLGTAVAVERGVGSHAVGRLLQRREPDHMY